MAIYDRWWKTERQDGTRKKVRSDDYGCRERWQVRWRDEQGRQRKKSFERKLDAEAADAKIRTQLADGSYVDPSAGQVTFRSYAEEWRRNRIHDLTTETRVEQNFRNHVYSADGRGGRTPQGGLSIGDYPMKILAQRPSLVQGWIKSLPLAANSQRLVIGYVGQVFKAGVADRIIAASPMKADVVQLPDAVKTPAVPWTAGQVSAVAAGLPGRLAAMPYLGAACGLRQGEMFAVALDDVSFLRKSLHVEVQVKILAGGVAVFAPLKNHRSCPSRDVPLAEPVIPVLSEHVRQHPPAAVTLPWRTPAGKPVTRNLIFSLGGGQLDRSAFNYQWRRAWRAAGVPDRGRLNGFHGVRHTAASAWLSAGLNPAKVAALLGDTLEDVLSTYAHFLPEDDDRARDIMGQFFAAADTAEQQQREDRQHG